MPEQGHEIKNLCLFKVRRFRTFEVDRNDAQNTAALAAGLHIGDIQRAIRSADELRGMKGSVPCHEKFAILFIRRTLSDHSHATLHQERMMNDMRYWIGNENIPHIV